MGKFIKYLIEMHRFFVRESQHYILGDWEEYFIYKGVKWNTDHPRSEQNKETYKYYKKNYKRAYIKFMRLCIKDYFK